MKSGRFSFILCVLSLIVPLNFFSCTFGNEDNGSKKSNISENQYGSLSIVTGSKNQSRKIDVSSIDKADVTVSGRGIASPLSRTDVAIGSGRAESVTIQNIPTGPNRLITVEAKTTVNTVSQKMAGLVMTAVCDIQSGENSVVVNWESTKVGNVYAELLKLDYNISNLSTDIVESYLPKDGQGKIISSGLINASLLASEIKAGTASTSKDYSVQTGSLTFSSDVSSSEITILVCDPVSSALTSVSSGTNTITNVAPGTWMVFGIVNGTTVVYKDSITIEAGETTVIPDGEIQFKAPKPRLENASGAQISEFITSATTVYLKARTLDGEKEPNGVAIYYTTDGTTPSTSSTLYNAANGINVTSGVTVKAIAICSGLLNSELSSWTFAQPSLGYTHPSSGSYSPVDMNGASTGYGWSSGTWALGANVSGSQTTFALYSANATKILLEIYGSAYGADAMYDYWMEKDANNVWRAKLSGDLTGAIYAFRVWGPNWTYSSDWTRGGSSAGFVSDCDSSGNRFNPNKVVYDPYAREMTHDASNASAIASYKTTNNAYALASSDYQILSTGETKPAGSSKAWREFDSGTISPKGYIITDSTSYGTKPAIPQKDAIIYEAHVRGITKHSSAANLSTLLSGYDGFDDVVDIPEEYRGTYKGAALLVPYLKALGINTIELLPVHETDNDANPDDGPGGNFWGYMTFDYFAPDRRYSSDKTAGGPTREFKEMVKTFHDAGMEVYLDVVYNHTGEGGTWHGSSSDANFDSGKQCTVVSMRGIDNQTYYSLVKGTKWSYWETTGCGNNMQCDNSTVRQFILDSLTYWIDEMGVDGFRFDLATTLGREYNSSSGNWNYNSSAATLTQIASLGKTKNAEMIAESWDCGDGSYQVGNFPDGWAGWNGYYRDNIRGFVGNAQAEAAISYTTGLYGDLDHFGVNEPSVNFVVAHDGFTLADLCSYSGSGNALNSTLTWPFGPSDGGNGDNNALGTGTDAASRRQRARNYFAMQMFSAGIPMIVYGDELGRTQNGNNNPYNLDSVATWNNYLMAATSTPQGAKTYASSGIAQETGTYSNMFGTYANTENKNGQLVFSSFVMNERLNNNSLRQVSGAAAPIEWYKASGASGWEDSGNAKAIMINGSKAVDGAKYYMLINMNGYQSNFTVPASSSGCHWVRIVDTGSWAEESFNCWKDSDESAYSFTAATEYGVGAYTVAIFKEVSDGPVIPTCATPSISGTTPFETSTSVTITCGTSGASIYYTTDGSTPSAGSTKYTGAFALTETTTVKAIAICDGYNNSSVASKPFSKKGEVVESSKSGVMLQGFNWDSAPRGNGYNAENPSPYWGRWYNVVANNASAISDTFDYLWCPPPSMTDTASSEGYAPTQLNNLNNCYGTETELKAMINAISPTKAIADIVINHRAGTTSWGDFTNPSWCDDYYAICSDDEGFSSSGSPMYNSAKKGNSDTGEGYSAYRDLDHTNTAVQQGIIDWMNNVLKPAGFVGWRYDYVKGFGGKYVGMYNRESSAEFSVGEHWPSGNYSASSWGPEIKSWISSTASENGQRSRAFDFALKGAMNTVFGNNASGVSNSNYALLADSSNLYISQPEDAVTFVDNHDTGSTQKHWYLDPNDVGTAYALILTHPGYPCVAWQHYFTYAESGSTGTDGGAQYLAGNTVAGTSNTLRQHIDKLIQIRKDLGIEYDSTSTTLSATNSVYAAKIVGTNGTLVVVIGGSYTPTGDYGRIYKGTNFTIWQEGAEDVYGGGGGGNEGVTLSVTVPDWVWNDGAVIFAWVWGDSSTGEWIDVSGSGTTATITVPADTKGFNMARCPAGTTAPSWTATGNSAGRIYNKTNDVTVTSGNTNYSTNWVEYNPS